MLLRGEASHRLWGRDTELAVIEQAVHRVVAGDGGILVVEGEPGIGKSSLLEAAAHLAERSSLTVLRAEADELDGDRPFVLFDQISSLAEVETGSQETSTAERYDGEYVVVDQILEDVEQRTIEHPAVLVLDDLQWADPGSLRVVRTIIRNLVHLRLLLVVALRPGPRSAHHDALVAEAIERGARHLVLGPLGDAPAAEVVGEVLGARPTVSLLAQLERTGGNPLYLIELSRALRAEDAIIVEDGEAELREAILPPGLRLTILRRLSQLDPETLRVLRTASVLGTRFSSSTLADVLGLPATELLPALDEARSSGFVREAGDKLTFAHDVVREVLYGELPEDVQRALHHQVAEALMRRGAALEDVDQHVAMAATGGAGPDSFRWLMEAGIRTQEKSRVAAIKLFDRARVAAAPGSPEHVRASVALANALTVAGRAERAEPILRDACERATDQVAARYALVTTLLHLGRTDDLVAEGRALVDRTETTAPDRAATCAQMGLQLIQAARVEESRSWIAQALTEAERGGDPDALAMSCATAAVLAHVDGDVDLAIRHADRAVQTAEANEGGHVGSFSARFQRGLVLLDTDRLDDARRGLEQGRRHSESTGAVAWASMYMWAAGLVDFLRGNHDDALASFETSVTVGEETETRITLLVIPIVLSGRIALARGNLAEADAAIDHAHRNIEEHGLGLGADLLPWLEALIAEARGEPDVAAGLLEQSWGLTASLPHLFSRRLLAPDAVRLLRRTNPSAAARIVGNVEDLASRSGHHEPVAALAERCRGLLDAEPTLIRSAATRLQDAGRPVDAALCREEAADAFARAGRVQEATEMLEEALSAFDAALAVRCSQRAQASLRELGVHRRRSGPQREDRVGWESLTPTELEVVRLVAEGLTNRQVGEQLFISRRTVETHLSHVFAKLGLANRSRLAAEAARQLDA